MRYWIGFALTAITCSVVWLAGLRVQHDVPTDSSRWVFEVSQKKLAAANAVSGPRVLVVAGSNALFGVDSAMIEQAWQRPVVNLAVNAGLGLTYILESSKRVARRGDLVLLPLEYALMLDDGKPNAQVIDYVIARDSDYWRRLDPLNKFLYAAGMAPERWVRGLRRLPDAPGNPAGTYGGHNIDPRGDQLHTDPADLTPGDAAAVKAAKAWSYGHRAKAEAGGWDQLAAYGRWARANGVCLLAVPTAMLRHASYADDPVEVAFFTSVPQRFARAGIAYRGQPLDFMYPQEQFFNTDHHLQAWARKLHTARLLRAAGADPDAFCERPEK